MNRYSIVYEQTGDGFVRVWINDKQYFNGVPEGVAFKLHRNASKTVKDVS
jgi:hypothetical protein